VPLFARIVWPLVNERATECNAYYWTTDGTCRACPPLAQSHPRLAQCLSPGHYSALTVNSLADPSAGEANNIGYVGSCEDNATYAFPASASTLQPPSFPQR
jgi:hypothetical protein